MIRRGHRPRLRAVAAPLGWGGRQRPGPSSRRSRLHTRGAAPTRLALAALACNSSHHCGAALERDLLALAPSPSRWGCPRMSRPRRLGDRCFPTPVGLHPSIASCPFSPRLPHRGGAAPERRVLAVLLHALSPRSWGCTRTPARGRIRHRTSPSRWGCPGLCAPFPLAPSPLPWGCPRTNPPRRIGDRCLPTPVGLPPKVHYASHSTQFLPTAVGMRRLHRILRSQPGDQAARRYRRQRREVMALAIGIKMTSQRRPLILGPAAWEGAAVGRATYA